MPVKKYTEGEQTVGSEWIYSDDSGARERRDTRNLRMTAPNNRGPGGMASVPPNMVRVQITPTGEKADRFGELRDELEEQMGYRPSRPEVVGYLMAQFDGDRHDRLLK